MMLFCRSGRINEGTKCNYYNCLSLNPKGSAGCKGFKHASSCIHSQCLEQAEIRNYGKMHSLIPTLDISTESMNNRVAETNRRVASSAPTDRGELCAGITGRKQGQWAMPVLYQENRTCFVFLRISLSPFHSDNTHFLTTRVSGNCPNICHCFYVTHY